VTSEPTQPANVDLYEAASRTMYAKWGFVGETADRLALQWATDLGHRAAVDAAFAAGREAAAQALIDHANIHFPDPTNSAQRTARRWLITAARVAAGPITLEQAAAALAAGNYATCRLDEAGRSIRPSDATGPETAPGSTLPGVKASNVSGSEGQRGSEDGSGGAA
jgi:hypothetical protein